MLPARKSTTPLGKVGEDKAVAFLEEQGYTILERNYHFERAEVDIIAYDQRKIILIEVKTRSNIRFEDSDQQLSKAQFDRIRTAGQAWLYERKMEGSPLRFDLITVLHNEGETVIRHYKDAISDWNPFK
jgi:putative endonuclease